MVELQINLITLIIGVGVPIIAGIGFGAYRKLDDLCTRVSRLEGRHAIND